MQRYNTAALLLSAAAAAAASAAGAQDYQTPGIEYNMPIFAPAMKAKLTYPLAWSPKVEDLPA